MKKDAEIIELYENGYSTSEIKERVSCSTGTIYNALKRNGRPTRNYKHGVNVEVKEEIKRRYLNRESVNKIHHETGIDSGKIKSILDEFCITKISASKRHNPNIDEDYFENIDTGDKAYWLGWLLTDGCIDKNSVSISLQARDRYILDQFAKDIGVENKVKVFNKAYYRLYFCSKKIVNDLSKYGIVDNKTFSVVIPDIDEKYVSDFLRGCFDGDGGFSILNSRGRTEIELSFCGNFNTVSKFNTLVSERCCLNEKNVTKNNSIFRVRWSKKEEVLKICEFFYNGASTHRLDRKYQMFLAIKNEV